MKRVIFLSILFLLFSCSMDQIHSVNVSILESHYWEYQTQKPMWLTLKYFDGEEVKKKTVFSTNTRFDIEIKLGRTAIFVAYPLDMLSPLGGGYTPGDDTNIYLHNSEGRLAATLLEALEYNPKLVANLNYTKLVSELGSYFDEEAFLVDLLNGDYSNPKNYKVKKYKVNIEAIPKGYYIPEYDDLPVFEISDGDSTATIELYPGLYRFLNCSSLIYISIRVNSDGSYDIRSYKPII